MALLEDYFEQITSPSHQGRVIIDNALMEDSRLFCGETIIFLHGGRMVKLARSASEVIASDNNIPRHFNIDTESIRTPRRMVRISEFQETLFKVAGIATNLASKNWNHLQDTDALIMIFDRL